MKAVDPEIVQTLEDELHRQRFGLEMIASENFTIGDARQMPLLER